MQANGFSRGSSYFNPSSDEDDAIFQTDGALPADPVVDDGQSIIGVSLGPAQVQLASPSATREEKIAALEKDETDYLRAGEAGLEEDHEERDEIYTPEDLLPESPDASEVESCGDARHLEKARGVPHDALQPKSPRTGDKALMPSDYTTWKKYVPSLPAMPSLPGLKSLSAMGKARTFGITQQPETSTSQSDPAKPRRNTLAGAFRTGGSSPSRVNGQHNPGPSSSPRPSYQSIVKEDSPRNPPARPQFLRRTTSESSLTLQRSLSRASSLGDDSRWTNVHEQVNSRAKAIRDSLADSNLKFPRLPDLPSLNISEVLMDFQATRKRSASLLTGISKRNQSPNRKQPSVSNGDQKTFIDEDEVASRGISPPPGMTKANAEAHPQFSRALSHLKGDLVILGGYRGSVLRSAEPPYRQFWVPVKVGLGLRKVDLEVGLEREDEERMEEKIIPSGMLKHIGPVDISRRLFKRLRSCKGVRDGTLRVWDFGYDWRLSPHLLSDRLINFLETLDCNTPGKTEVSERGATVIAHSLGGLVTRHAVNRRPELFSGIVYAGVPQTCVNILGPLRNGDEVLLSSKVLTAQVNFTIRTSFALLPLDGKCFFNRETNERFDVDFFSPQDWQEYCLSPCVARPISIPQDRPAFIGSIVESMTSALPNLNITGRNRSESKRGQKSSAHPPLSSHGALDMQMNKCEEPEEMGKDPETSPSTAVTITKSAAMAYLARTLAEIKRFKQELAFDPDLDERHAYPPTAVIYGKSVPTVYGACVKDREGIKRSDAYDDLAFASGDGVVLARAAQLPEGYKASRGGVVSSDRGHISLLGDLEAVGRCLNAVKSEREQRAAGRQMT